MGSIDRNNVPMIVSFDGAIVSIVVDLLEEKLEYQYNYLSFFEDVE